MGYTAQLMVNGCTLFFERSAVEHYYKAFSQHAYGLRGIHCGKQLGIARRRDGCAEPGG
jgi:hypothetical protein